MDVEKAMEQLGVAKDAYRVLGLLPLVYVAWADGKIQDAERTQIFRHAGEMGWLLDGGEQTLQGWLQTKPTEDQVKTGIKLLNHLAGETRDDGVGADLTETSLSMLLVFCRNVAQSAGGFLGFGAKVSDHEDAALANIAEALDIRHAKKWYELVDSHKE